MFVAWLIGSIIVTFFTWKKYSGKIEERQSSGYSRKPILEIKEFWIVVFWALFYPFLIPCWIIWTILEKITKRFYKN